MINKTQQNKYVYLKILFLEAWIIQWKKKKKYLKSSSMREKFFQLLKLNFSLNCSSKKSYERINT